MAEPIAERGSAQDRSVAIANAITRLHRQYYGRGAASARTLIGRDQVVVLLEDIYTTVERTLIDAGHFEAVQATRHAFQQTMRVEFSTAVEEIMGRRVVGFMSQVHENPDVAAEIFLFEREDAG